MRAKLLLGVVLLATALLYWAGLHGPFLLDDTVNLAAVGHWLSGETTWQHVVFDNRSGPLGRPLSMASFLLTSALWGADPFAFKLGNLIVHLACGLLGWQVLRRALARDPHLAGSADLVAALLAAIWLLHPLNVSTVLYAVQRMAQLSTLFVLASLWTYLAARQQLVAGKLRPAVLKLFLLFPLLLVAGLLCKENAAVAPALCLVLELAYFLRTPRPRAVPLFFGIFVLLPAILIAGLLLVEPGRWLSYSSRDFTLVERLLSQPRALLDYIGLLLFPRNPLLGLFTDDFAASTSLVSPISTLWSLLALLAISVFAVVVRKRAPSVFAGWFFFLVAHTVESGILPLELYFEHRNYLPAFGLWLAVAGLCEWATRNARTNVLSLRQLGLLVAGGFILALAFATLGRALVWQHNDTIVAQALKMHPTSLRANLASADVGIQQGNYQQASEAMSRLLQSPHPRDRLLGRLNRVVIDCAFAIGANPDDLREAVKLAQPKITLAEMNAFEALAAYGAQPHSNCGPVSPDMAADSISRIVATATQSDAYQGKWRSRLVAAMLYGRAEDWSNALVQAKLAWQPTSDPAAGGFLVRAYAHNGMMAQAERTYQEVARRISPDDTNGKLGLAELRRFLDSYAEAASK
jgi:tetratricopeptide (TPR) repeat protein